MTMGTVCAAKFHTSSVSFHGAVTSFKQLSCGHLKLSRRFVALSRLTAMSASVAHCWLI
jgi:hypothetical protein